jgi:ABC-type molybdate transport system substrate-binding protein
MALEYQVAMVTGSDQIAAIRQLFEFLTTTEARAGFAETGVEN